MTDVFIGCGSFGDRALADRVADALQARGYNVCRDDPELDVGDHIERIVPAITECSDFAVLLTPGVFAGCARRDDPMRLELESAFRHRRNVLILRSPEFEWDGDLPENISQIEFCRTVELDPDDLRASVDKLTGMFTAKPSGY